DQAVIAGIRWIRPAILGPAARRSRAANRAPERTRPEPGAARQAGRGCGAVAGPSSTVRYNARPPRPCRCLAARCRLHPHHRTHPMSDSSWLHEQFEPTGSSIGFRITRKLDEVQSPFQKIEIYESTDWGNVMLIDGAMMVTTRDNFLYH